MAKNIILTTITKASDILHLDYFGYHETSEDGLGECVFSHSLVDGEAIIKYILSKYPIDEIMVFGSKADYNKGDELKNLPLKGCTEFLTASQEDLSTYSLFRYRLSQYIDNVEFTGTELYEYFTAEEIEKLEEAFNEYYNAVKAQKRRPKKMFIDVAESNELWEEAKQFFCQALGVNKLSEAHIAIIQYRFYNFLSDRNKMAVMEENEDITISYIPIGHSDNSQNDALLHSIKKLWNNNDEEINIYVGVHNANASDSSFSMSLLNMFKELGKINVKKVYSVQHNDDGFGFSILDDTDLYLCTNLINGLLAFVNTGKVDRIMECMEQLGYRDDFRRNIIYAMRNIDASISLCDIDEMVKGIESLRNLLKQYQDDDSFVHSLFDTVIKRGYGSLIESDTIDILELIKWAYSKKLYQQTLTIIESKIPEDLFNRGLYYFCNSEEDKDAVLNQFADVFNSLKRYETYKMKDIKHYFVKFYGRTEAKNGSARDPKLQALKFAQYKVGQIETIGNDLVKDNKCTDEMISAHTLTSDLGALEDALFAYYYIGNVRNLTNHAENAGGDEIELFPDITENIQKMKLVNEAILYFIQKYEAVVHTLDDVIPEGETAASVPGGPVDISPREVRSLARKITDEKLNNQK